MGNYNPFIVNSDKFIKMGLDINFTCKYLYSNFKQLDKYRNTHSLGTNILYSYISNIYPLSYEKL